MRELLSSSLCLLHKGSLHPMTPLAQVRAVVKGHPTPGLSVGSIESFVVNVSQLNFSLCSVLFSSLPAPQVLLPRAAPLDFLQTGLQLRVCLPENPIQEGE